MSRDAVRGSFGLFTTTGNGAYRHIRMLRRDAHDPAARIERQLTLEKRLSDPEARAPGVFQGLTPPNINQFEGDWIQGEAIDLKDRHGAITVIAFWTAHQDEIIPTSAYYSMLAEKYRKYGLKLICVCTNQPHTAPQVLDWLTTHPLEDISLYYDTKYKIYPAFNIGNGGLDIPRILVLDVDGKVYWEGDPNLPLKRGWDPESPVLTPLDTIIEELISDRKMREILKFSTGLAKAEDFFEQNKWAATLEAAMPLAELDADYSPHVHKARLLIDKVEAEGASLPNRAEQLIDDGYPLQAQQVLTTLVEEFAGTAIADDLGAPRKRKLERSSLYRTAKSNMRKLEKARQHIEGGRTDDAREILRKMKDVQTCAEITDVSRKLEKRLGL